MIAIFLRLPKHTCKKQLK